MQTAPASVGPLQAYCTRPNCKFYGRKWKLRTPAAFWIPADGMRRNTAVGDSRRCCRTQLCRDRTKSAKTDCSQCLHSLLGTAKSVFKIFLSIYDLQHETTKLVESVLKQTSIDVQDTKSWPSLQNQKSRLRSGLVWSWGPFTWKISMLYWINIMII